jgi:8-oxo-dGTP pyrophosphatase MutT (NUDIX family)
VACSRGGGGGGLDRAARPAIPLPLSGAPGPGPGDQQAPGEGAVYLLVDRRGHILLQQRDDNVPPAGYGRWALPGGHIEPGEEPLAAAHRELEEETGLRVRALTPFGLFDQPGLVPGTYNRLHVFASGDEVDAAAICVNEGLDFRFQAPAGFGSLLMNPFPREVLERFVQSALYAELSGRAGSSVAVIALDRWGRALLRTGTASPGPGIVRGAALPGEPPDAAALRAFEEATALLIDGLKLWRAWRLPGGALEHVYFADPDIPLEEDGGPLRYAAPGDLEALSLPQDERELLRAFFASPAYRALFH